MGRNHRREQISNTSIIAKILLFCRSRTWFPWTLIHDATFICEYEVHYFPLNCLLFLFALTSIPTYVYRVFLERSKRSIDEIGDFATSWNAAGKGLKCALALPLCGCANTPTTGDPGCPSTEMKNLLYCQGAFTSKYPVPSGPRDTKGFNIISPIFIKLIFFYLLPSEYKNILSVLQEHQKERKGPSADAHWRAFWCCVRGFSWPPTPRPSPRGLGKDLSEDRNFFIKRLSIWKKMAFPNLLLTKANELHKGTCCVHAGP